MYQPSESARPWATGFAAHWNGGPPPPSTDVDAWLIESVLQGRTDAFGELVIILGSSADKPASKPGSAKLLRTRSTMFAAGRRLLLLRRFIRPASINSLIPIRCPTCSFRSGKRLHASTALWRGFQKSID